MRLGFVFDDLAGEGGLDVRANPVPGFGAEDFLERASDHLLARQAEPARVLLVAPDIASVGSDVRYERRQAVTDQLEPILAPQRLLLRVPHAVRNEHDRAG